VQSALSLLLGVIALALFAGIVVVASIAGAALRRAVRYAAVAGRPKGSLAELASGPGVAHGFVALPGDAGERELLKSPISGRPCVYYELNGTYMGRPCFSHREALPCVLNDGTAELPLDPAHSDLVLERATTWRAFAPDRIPPEMNDVMKARLLKVLADLRAAERREPPPTLDLTERALHVGEGLYVSGTLMRVGASVSLVGGHPTVAADRPFPELARREALIALGGIALALFVISVLVSIGSAILARMNG
jgi:hypothetical protein